jgi:hypothetical protein
MGLGRSRRERRPVKKTKSDYMVGPRAHEVEEGTVDDADAAVEADAPWNADIERREASVPAELHGQRLDKAVVTMADEFSRNHLQSLIEAGHVQVDGVPSTTASRKVRAGQVIAVDLVPTAESRAFRPEAICSSSTSRPAWSCTRRRATGPARC